MIFFFLPQKCQARYISVSSVTDDTGLVTMTSNSVHLAEYLLCRQADCTSVSSVASRTVQDYLPWRQTQCALLSIYHDVKLTTPQSVTSRMVPDYLPWRQTQCTSLSIYYDVKLTTPQSATSVSQDGTGLFTKTSGCTGCTSLGSITDRTWLTFSWWGCCSSCFWYKPTELAHSFFFF